MKINAKNWVSILSLILLAACSTPEVTNTITQSEWRGPNRDGIYPEKGLLTEWPEEGSTLLWKFTELGEGFSSPTFVGEKMFISGTIDSVSYLFNLDLNGNLIWKTAYGKEWMKSYPGVRSSPTIVDDQVYILSGIGELFCLSAENGSLVWKKNLITEFGAQPTQYGMSENLLIDGDMIFCTPGGAEYNVIALNRFTGELIWSNKGMGEKSAYANPRIITIGKEKYYITMTDKSVLSINITTGELAWSQPLDGIKSGAHANSPYYRDGYLFLMDGFEVGAYMFKIAEDGKSAERVWKNEIMDETQGHSVVVGDNIYGSAESKNKLVCLDWKTGEEKFELRKYAPGTSIFADNHLYIYGYSGVVGLVEPTETEFIDRGSFKLPKRSELHIAHPVIHNGVLYIRYVNELFAYNIKKK